MKIVINKCFGGFGLSQEAYKLLIEKHGIKSGPFYTEKRGKDGLYIRDERNDGEYIYDKEKTPCEGEHCLGHSHCNRYKETPWDRERYWESWTDDIENRSNPKIVAVVEELGEKANGRFADLKVVEIPDGVEWEIDEYDGIESVREVSQYFG